MPTSKPNHRVEFVAVEDVERTRDGSEGWIVKVDGEEVLKLGVEADLDIGNKDFEPLWERLGIEMKWDYD